MADVFAPQPVKTKVAGDVVVNVNTGQTIGLSSGASIVGKVGIDQTTPGTTNAVSVTNASIPVTGTFFQTTQPVSIATNTPTLQAGSAVVGKFGIDQTTPGTTNAVSVTNASLAVTGTFFQGTQPVSLATNTPTLQTGSNVIGSLTANQSTNTTQLGGIAIAVGSGASSTGTQRVILATDQGTIPVSSGLSFTTVDSGHLTSVSLAAGATITLDGAQITAGTAKLFEATVASSVALKAQLGTWDGTTFSVKRTFFVAANTCFEYSPTRYDSITFPTGATAKFRWSITNNDNSNAADVYASITHAL